MVQLGGGYEKSFLFVFLFGKGTNKGDNL